MAAKKLHPMLELLKTSLPNSNLNSASKANNFKFALSNEASGILTGVKLNEFLKHLSADMVAFGENIQRKAKIDAICGYIDEIFLKNDHLAADSAIVAFSAADLKKAVNDAMAKDKLERAHEDKLRQEQIDILMALEKRHGAKRKELETIEAEEVAVLARLKEVRKKKRLLADHEDLSSSGESSDEEDHEDAAAMQKRHHKQGAKDKSGSLSFSGGGGGVSSINIQSQTQKTTNFDTQTLNRIVVSNFDPNMKAIELAQSIAAISAIMFGNFAIVPSIRGRVFFDFFKLLPFSADASVSMVAAKRQEKYLSGQNKNWKAGVMDSWNKFMQAMTVWITFLTEIDPPMIPQVVALQSTAMLFRGLYESDHAFEKIFLLYANAMVHVRLREAEVLKRLPDFETLDATFMPAASYTKFGELKRAAESQFAAVAESSSTPKYKLSSGSASAPRRVVLYKGNPDDPEDLDEYVSEDEEEEEVEASEVIITKFKKPIAKPSPCFAHNLGVPSPACKNSTCTFCNRGGNFCMVCGNKTHGAANCLDEQHKKAQLDYFISVLKPSASKKNGWHPIYGGAPFKLFGYPTLEDWQAAIQSQKVSELHFATAANNCRKEAKKLQKGQQPSQAFLYPGARGSK